MNEAGAMTDRCDRVALALALDLPPGERAEVVDVDPGNGDYRVFHLSAAAMPAGRKTLTFELHRQGPGFERLIFNVLSLTLGPIGADGLRPVEVFVTDAGATPADLPRLLPVLAGIVAALRSRRRPEDALLSPLLSTRAQTLWTQPLTGEMAS